MDKAFWIASETFYRRVIVAVYLVIALVTGGALSWQFNEIRHDTERMAVERGATLFNLIEITREWNARHGGVYVAATAESPANPYLKHPRRDISDNFGRALTMINPAYMTRQIGEIAADHQGVRLHITSLRPVRPDNKADAWETESLELFEKTGRKERIAFLEDGGGIVSGPAYRYMSPLLVGAPCLNCHASQGYKIGDIRGGISVTMPARELLAVADRRQSNALVFGMLCASLVAFLIHLVAFRTHRHFKLLTELNTSLEIKVDERTQEVKKLYEHEHYLRELLSTVSEINLSLIHSYSMGSIIESSIEKLKNHDSYKLIMFSHFDGQRCHVRHVIGDRYGLLKDDRRELDALLDSPLLRTTGLAIRNRNWSSDDQLGPLPKVCDAKRADDYVLTASIAFPLIDGEDAPGLDVLTFWTNRAEGFDPEEIRILNTVASDITMALSAYKQRQLSERLYKENITNYEETILAFVDMIEQRDAYTAGHTLRVARYCRLIAEHMGLDADDICRLEKAAILHDIGKIATPDAILLKPSRLNSLEYGLIQLHVSAGYKMLSKVKMYSELAEIIKFHHERHDGKGYPKGYQGDEIPREGQIMILADAFDAMTTNRIYKGRLSVADAILELKANRGTQFHPLVVEAATACLADITIDDVNQLPISDLEKQRFSYFFNDTLTGLFNIAYLQLIVNREEAYICANVIQLKHFSEFNRQHGWAVGNQLLIHIAQQLRSLYPQSLIFRFHGDDFLVVSRQHIDIDPARIDLGLSPAPGIVSVAGLHFDLRIPADRQHFKEALELD